jgi:protein-disulfide isomerase
MTSGQSASLILLLALTGGSTCRGQSQNGEPVAKDPSSSAPEVTMPGVDTSALTPRERKEWSTYVSEFLAPCPDVPVSVAQCVQEKRPCGKCLPAAKFVLKGVRDGQTRDQIEKAYKNRFDADKIRDVPIDGSPSKGPESAAVTIVEFADFECPFCGVMAPVLERARAERNEHVRIVYKFMPLGGHPHGEPAARAAIAAGNQGKFWEMHKKLFENQKRLEQSDLEGYAKELGLDLARFRSDMNAPATTERIERDRKLADKLEVKGTPTIYINGREFQAGQDLNDWIALELQTKGIEPKAAAGAQEGPGSATGVGDAGPRAGNVAADAGGAALEARAADAGAPKTR